MTILALLVVALAFLLLGGGRSPSVGVPGTMAIVGPTVEAIFVMDPHDNDSITPLARHGAVFLRYRKLSRPEKIAAAVFTLPPTFQLGKGCDPSVVTATTPDRVTALDRLITEAAIIRPLFAELGITLSPTTTPVIARVRKQGCTTGGAMPGIPEPVDGVGKGMLWMVVDLKMQVERGSR
jgi:hypothetical protein